MSDINYYQDQDPRFSENLSERMKTLWHRFWLRWHLWRQQFEAAALHWRALGCPGRRRRPTTDEMRAATERHLAKLRQFNP